MKKITIAIDGFSSCGKSTMAKDLAKEIGYIYIDTGAMYRAVTLYAIKAGLFNGETVNQEALEAQLDKVEVAFKLDEQTQKPRTLLNGEDVEERIRTMEVSSKVSVIAAIAAVRAKLVELQQQMGKGGGIVMDGRDIGTIIIPDAEFKFYLVASSRVRAERRYKELVEKGQTCDLDQVEQEIIERDYRDSHRDYHPLKKADDAIEVDTSNLTIQQVIDTLKGIINA